MLEVLDLLLNVELGPSHPKPVDEEADEVCYGVAPLGRREERCPVRDTGLKFLRPELYLREREGLAELVGNELAEARLHEACPRLRVRHGGTSDAEGEIVGVCDEEIGGRKKL